jgi:membrane-anchored protein YejM (alkaline phosphatase superfamily)
MFSESNERLIKRRHESGKSDKVPEGQEQAEKLRGDVEAQHGGANASGAQHDRPAHGQDGGFLATSPFGQFCDHAAGVLLGNSRSVTFIMALINSTIQILIYVFSLSTIINNYDPELHKNNYPQYLMHHLGYFNYMVFHCLFTGVMSWAVLHLCLYICRSFFRLCTNALLSSPEVPASVRSVVKGCGRYPISLCVSVFVLAVVEIILLALYVLECRLLVDMSVHLIDLDLVEILGIKQVLERQRELGAGLDPEHWPYIKLVVALLLLGQAACFFLARLILRKLTRQKLRKFFLCVGLVIMVTGLLVVFQTAFIYEDVEHYRGQLPFNYIDPNPIDRLIPIIPRTNTAVPPVPGAGYPLMGEELAATVRRKKNVIIISVESMRHDDATHIRSPHLMKYVEDNKCISPQVHAGSGHVSEMGQFALIYGLHAYHYHSFAVGHIPSYAYKVLKQNGYVIGGAVATSAWNYPNRNLYNNFDEFDSMNDNYAMLEKAQEFIDRRKEDKKPFLFFMHVHKRPVPDPLPADYHQRDPEGDTREFSNRIIRQKDEDRHRALEMLRAAGMVDGKSIVFFISDHGNMEGEHGEKGHGQRESSWWNEKALLPSFICLPGEDMDQYQRPALGSHVDYVPTFMDYLDLNPPIDPKAYSNGKSLLIKKDQPDWTADRMVAFSARYFPEKNKVNAVGTTEFKFWFRVARFDPATRHMEFVPIKATRWDDESLCLPPELRAEWARVLQDVAAGREIAEGRCKMKQFYALSENYRREMFHFLDVDQAAYE